MPSLREKKRYIVYEILSKNKIFQKQVEREITKKTHDFLGIYGASEAGIQFLKDWNQEKQRGIVRINNKKVDHIKTTMGLINQISEEKVSLNPIKVSGTLKKVRQEL